MPKLKLLTIGHSYVVYLNRRLAHEIANVDNRWSVTVGAPAAFPADLGEIKLETNGPEPSSLVGLRTHLNKSIQIMAYGKDAKALLKQPWDLVHCWEEPYTYACKQIARWTLKKTVFSFYTFQNQPKKYPPPFSWFEESCLNRCDGWSAAGHSVAEAQLGRGYNRKVHKILPLGVDLDRFKQDAGQRSYIRDRLGFKPEDLVVGFVGRFVPEKGLDLLMRVFDRLKTKWSAMFVGGGPEEPRLREWSKNKSNVRIVTGVKHGEVPVHLNGMDILCAPSHTTSAWREQFGRMLIEAFATGVPVVASDSGEIPYVVGKAGLILPEKDEDQWLLTIEQLLQNHQERAALTNSGLERVHAEYSWLRVAHRHIDFFDQMLSAKAK